MALHWNITRKRLITGFLAVLGMSLVIWGVWGFAHIPKLKKHLNFPGSRVKARQLDSDSNEVPSGEFRDAEMISSDSPDLAILNITTSDLKALEGEYCENHKGCDLAFTCVDHKCIKGCTKRNDCAGWQECKNGKCHFMRRECLAYEKPCTVHEECCSGYCGDSGNYYNPTPMVCKRFFYPKPDVPGQPGDPKDLKIPTDPTDPKNPGEPKNPEDPKEPGKPKEPKKPKQPKKPKKPKKPKFPKKPKDPTKPKEPKKPKESTKPKDPMKPKPPKGKDPNHPKKPQLDEIDEFEDNENEDSVEDVDENVDENVAEEAGTPTVDV